MQQVIETVPTAVNLASYIWKYGFSVAIMTLCKTSFVLDPLFRYCLLVLVTLSGVSDGVTLFVNSKYPPPPPFITSLYRAPQTYDRGKSSRAPRPFIIIAKARPCYNLESARHFGLVKSGPPVRPQQGPPPSTSRPTWTVIPETNQLLPSVWSATRTSSPASHSTQEFKGNWQIIKPILKEDLDDRVVKYNKDGTRVVHETLYNFHTREPQIAIQNLKGVKVHPSQLTSTPSQPKLPSEEATTGSVTVPIMAPANLPKLTITAQYHISSATAQNMSTSSERYIITTPKFLQTTSKSKSSSLSAVTSMEVKTTQTLKPIAVASSYHVYNLSKNPEVTTRSTSTKDSTVNSPVSEESSSITSKPNKSFISKLGGGAQHFLNQIFGGLLNGRHTKDKNGDALSNGNSTAIVIASAEQENMTVSNASFHENNVDAINVSTGIVSEHITKKLPNSFWSQLQFLKEELEKGNPKHNDAIIIPTITKVTMDATTQRPMMATWPHLSQAEEMTSTASASYEFSTMPFEPSSLSESPQDAHLPLHQNTQDNHQPFGQIPQELMLTTQLPTDNSTWDENEYSDVTALMTADELAIDMTDIPNSFIELSPMLNGKMNYPTSCPGCADLTQSEEKDDGHTTSTSGWRPMRRPVPFLPDPPRAPAPSSIHQWLHSTWNDTSDWWTNEQEQEMSSTDYEQESTTEKSASERLQKPTAIHYIPRLPSQTQNNFDVTTYRPLLGLSPIHWLFGLKGGQSSKTNDSQNATIDSEMHEDAFADAQEIDIETRVNDGEDILDVPTSRIKPTRPVTKHSVRKINSAQLPKHAQLVNQTDDNNSSQIVRDRLSNGNYSGYRLKIEKNREGEITDEQTFSKNISAMISPAEMITEIRKLYKTLKVGLGLPLPLDIIEPLITMKYKSMKALQDSVHDDHDTK